MALIVYEGVDEILVCTKKAEKEMLKLWFKKGGRDVNDFDRKSNADDIVCCTASLKASD